MCHFILDHNSHVSWWIFTLPVLIETGTNTLHRSHKIYNFTLTVSPHYLIKLKPHKTGRFEVNRHSIAVSQSVSLSTSDYSVVTRITVLYKLYYLLTYLLISSVSARAWAKPECNSKNESMS